MPARPWGCLQSSHTARPGKGEHTAMRRVLRFEPLRTRQARSFRPSEYGAKHASVARKKEAE